MAKSKVKKEDKLTRLEQVMVDYNKASDAEAQITLLTDDAIIDKSVKPLPSGILSLDKALGIGGYPQGRIVEVFGPESSGKTTITLHAIAEAQRLGGIAAFLDLEHALDLAYAKSLGVQVDKLLFSQPNSGESALSAVSTLANILTAGDIIVVDSVSALTPQKELDGEIGDQFMGLQARLMSQAMRMLVGSISKSGVIVMFVNQIRMKLNVTYGSPETTSGGNALKFSASVRLDVRRTGSNKKGEEIINNKTKIKVVKNKVAPPFKEAHTIIKFGEGVPRSSDVLKLAIDNGIASKTGAWFNYGDIKLGHGEPGAADFLKENPELLDEIEAKVKKELGI